MASLSPHALPRLAPAPAWARQAAWTAAPWLLPLALFAVGLLACRWALALWRGEAEAAPVLETAK